MTWYLNDDTDVYEGPNEPDRIIRAVLEPNNGLYELMHRIDGCFGSAPPVEPGTHPSKLERQYGRLF